ncbi:MAG: Rieske 2Fe-2S domain-containing protein [Ilumatobacteraceae bacterium]
MRATSVGHAGILIECDAGSILCDPWFVPAFLGSWFVFPRNDQLSPELSARIEQPDYLYVSHLHGDHLDEPWLSEHLRRDVPILLPDYPTGEQERTLRSLGFTQFIHTRNGVETELVPGLSVAIHVETSITDGPGGDSALVVSDGWHRLVNQNDCRTTDLTALAAHGPVDLHWLQYSGAIWYPMVYDLPADEMARLCSAKTESQGARAMRYVEALGARAVVPSAGPPAFLDDGLFDLNVIDGDEPSIFPDQRWFLERLDAAGHRGVLAIPGTTITIGDEIVVEHPMPDDEVRAIFTDKRAYLGSYRDDWSDWLADLHRSWAQPRTDIVTSIAAWWEPLMRLAPTVCAAIGAPLLIRTDNGDDDLDIIIDFPNARVVNGSSADAVGLEPGFRFVIARDLLETVVAENAVDWSNSLLLSCRFRAWRSGAYNEYLYNFIKSLSVERMTKTEAEAASKNARLHAEVAETDDVQVGEFIVQRRCPHRNADLSIFGEIDGDDLVCTLHGWRFDTTTGQCRTSDDHPVRIRRRGT